MIKKSEAESRMSAVDQASYERLSRAVEEALLKFCGKPISVCVDNFGDKAIGRVKAEAEKPEEDGGGGWTVEVKTSPDRQGSTTSLIFS